jgi:hypothetical protein
VNALAGYAALGTAVAYAVVVMHALTSSERTHRRTDLLIVLGATWLPIAALWHLAAVDVAAHGGSAMGADAAAVVSLVVGIAAQAAGLTLLRRPDGRIRPERSPRYAGSPHRAGAGRSLH